MSARQLGAFRRAAALTGAALAFCSSYCAAQVEDYRAINPVTLAPHVERLLEGGRLDLDPWRQKPPLRATFEYPLAPTANDALTRAAEDLKRGVLKVDRVFEARELGVPPPWDVNPFGSSTYDFYLHALRWTEPLTRTWIADGDAESLALLRRVLESWIRENAVPPGRSKFAWDDHAAAYRLRILCWVWELWRRSDDFDEDLARLLLASVYQHAAFMCDPRNYPSSNHGMQMDGSLLAAALTFPEFRAASFWDGTARTRLARYAADAFSPAGFHREQSPGYHWYVLERLAQILEFTRLNGQPAPPAVEATVERAAAVFPWLVRPDRALPNVGDSGGYGYRAWRGVVEGRLGRKVRAAAPSVGPDETGARLLLDADVGYALFLSHAPESVAPEASHALFRCNSFRYAHAQRDALSFELFAHGREWLVDAGKFNYEEQTPVRQYMRSARAHNVVLIDDQDFDFRAMRVEAHGSAGDALFVTARHELPEATHTRRFEYTAAPRLRLDDELRATDGKPHRYSQLLHAAPGLKAHIINPREAHITDGTRTLIVRQAGTEGAWVVIEGQMTPFVQGWYSREFNKKAPAAALYYRTSESRRAARFETSLEFADSGARATERSKP